MNELMVKLRFLIPTLPRAEKAVAQALLEKPELICLMTLAELARETDSSDASIIRFCRNGTVNVMLHHREAILLRIGGALTNLTLNGFFSLAVSGITGIDHSGHGRHLPFIHH